MLSTELASKLPAAEAVVSACRARPELLDLPELGFLKAFVDGEPYEVPTEEKEEGGNVEDATAHQEDGTMPPESDPFPPLPEPVSEAPEDADWSLASDKKNAASAAVAEGRLEDALSEFTAALQAEAATGSISASSLAKRAECLLKMKRPAAASRDCDAALKVNPDSVKALKTRGRAGRLLGKFVDANLDLAAAQNIDYDPELEELCAFVKEKAAQVANKEREAQRKKDLEKRKKAAAAQRQREQEEEEARRTRQNVPPPPPMGGGIPGLDAETAAAMQNPKVMAAFQEMMSGGAPDPTKIMKYMSDPEVGPVLQKLMSKMGAGMPGMGAGMPGMPGGMPGMGAGMPSGFGNGFDAPQEDDPEMPDLEEVDEVD